jgi:hypothetical protein
MCTLLPEYVMTEYAAAASAAAAAAADCSTTGGTAHGEECMFPFTYKGEKYGKDRIKRIKQVSPTIHVPL